MSVIAGYERKKLWAIGPKRESKMGKERQFTMLKGTALHDIVISICISSGNIVPQF